jgi:predicted O-methyltransferase YrrM
MILNLDSTLCNIDLSRFNQYVSWHYLNAYFPMEAGQNHHQLLAYLSWQLPDGSKVFDLGTQYGASALALSYNPNVLVTTYDVNSYIPRDVRSFRDVSNITGVIGNCFDYISNFTDAMIVFLDISPHNGEDERRVLRMLLECNFKGILVCDDINLSDEMRSFFSDVTLKKYDVTHYGHWSGTGIIVFDEDFMDVRVK